MNTITPEDTARRMAEPGFTLEDWRAAMSFAVIWRLSALFAVL